MLDIGWSELLVIAVVLIVVVGPKDLPPMLRAFGKMTTRLRKTAGEFRAQFDEALREADMDDLRRTIDDAQRLNPANALREAINPLRQMGADIKADLQRSTQIDHFPEDDSSRLPLPDAPARPMTAEDLPPLAPLGDTLAKPQLPGSAAAAPMAAAASENTVAGEKPKRTRKAKDAAAEAEPVKPAAKSKTVKAKSVKEKATPVEAVQPMAEALAVANPPVAKPKAKTRTKAVAKDDAVVVAAAAPTKKPAIKKVVSEKTAARQTKTGQTKAKSGEGQTPGATTDDTSKGEA
ncbi:Sec-independent protein translocase protein TatB [Allorhizobium taibaishanense]|uniref:Sec-independent protein translocase protein TatB n=1 Tax=Allorhizobium taibaishanense TaxID=887144 RepID=A0A1Q9A353_9HYPH|nr:Sec-independent protein translocase protein TatB [Allorhizobium taibaishanense]MBB4006025.1 sec-independent protein translocase protein TatB [Allorhizobium taibaishanense]OLP49043.1 twin arginine-targeting protein translocase TatB [Allorhizobium taibaishanense]